MEIVVPDEFKHLYVKTVERPVVKIPDPVLRKIASEVVTDKKGISKKTNFLIDEMMRIMRKANGVGLAAPQVGISQRLFVMAPLDFRPTALINPRSSKPKASKSAKKAA